MVFSFELDAVFISGGCLASAFFATFMIWWLYRIVKRKEEEEEEGGNKHYRSVVASLLSQESLLMFGWIVAGFSMFCYWSLYIGIGYFDRPISCNCLQSGPSLTLSNCDIVHAFWLEWLDFGVGLIFITLAVICYGRIKSGWYHTMLTLMFIVVTMPMWSVMSCDLWHRWWFVSTGGLFFIIGVVLSFIGLGDDVKQKPYGYISMAINALAGIAYGIILVISPEFGYNLVQFQWESELAYLIFNLVFRYGFLLFMTLTFTERRDKSIAGESEPLTAEEKKQKGF